MKVKVVRESDKDDSPITMLVIYADHNQQAEKDCLHEILSNAVSIIQNHLQENSDARTDSND